MKKILIPILHLMIISCSNDELAENNIPIVNSVVESSVVTKPKIESKTIGDTTYIIKIIPTQYKLYKESVKNKRSGIFFQWQENYGVNPLYLPQTDEYFKAYFGGGDTYGDVNGDGYMDYLTAVHSSIGDVELKWFINNGDNYHFKNNTSMFNQSTKGFNAHKILKTDVNNDGISDYISLGVDERIKGSYTGNFTVLIGNLNRTFDVKVIPNPNKYWFHTGAAGDVNGDGNVDVIAATFLWLGDGTGNFIKSDVRLEQYCKSTLSYEIADMNGDGFNDLILSTVENLDNTTIVINNGGKFDSMNTVIKLNKVGYQDTMDIEIYDIDSDGDLDIIDLRMLGGGPDNDQYNPIYSKTKLFTYLNNGSSFQYVPEYIQNSEDGGWKHGDQSVGIGYQDKNGWSRFKFDDIDGDGVDDIIAINFHNGKYNGLKKINGVWKQHIFSFQKCKK